MTVQAQSAGRLVLRPGVVFNGVKVFSATMFADRGTLGEKVTSWIEAHKNLELSEMIVTQSSDDAFHCVAITVFYRDPAYAT